jgi:hypothetical protein
MSDLTTIASLSTAGGTLVLAVATFSSVRASQRSARIAEQALQIGLRPVLAPTNTDDHSLLPVPERRRLDRRRGAPLARRCPGPA